MKPGILFYCLNYFNVFHQVAHFRSFTKAAENLNISQPAVTQQIKALEQMLGVCLFKRDETPIALTEAGKELFVYAEKAFQILREAEGILGRYQKASRGTLRIGFIKIYSNNIMLKIISEYQIRHPMVKIILSVGSSEALQSDIRKAKLDLVFLSNPDFSYKDLIFMPFRKEKLVCISAPSYSAPLKIPRTISISEVAKHPFIIPEKGSGSYNLIMKAFEGEGINPEIFVESSSPEFSKEWVKREKGLAITSAICVKDEKSNRELRVSSLQKPLTLKTYVVFLKSQADDDPLKSFLDFLKNQFNALSSSV